MTDNPTNPCPDCGAVIGYTAIHKRWHRQMAALAELSNETAEAINAIPHVPVLQQLDDDQLDDELGPEGFGSGEGWEHR